MRICTECGGAMRVAVGPGIHDAEDCGACGGLGVERLPPATALAISRSMTAIAAAKRAGVTGPARSTVRF